MSTSPHTPFDAALLIGRFQPFHNGHAAVLKAALARAARVLVVLGSAFRSRSAKNPFDWEERAAMIRATLDAADAVRLTFLPIRDYYDDRRWAAAVEEGVRVALPTPDGESAPRIALLGFHKDATSDYLNLFPRWPFVALERQGKIDASAVRQIYFAGSSDSVPDFPRLDALLPAAVVQTLKAWTHHPAYATLRAEHAALLDYQKRWGSGPFVTLDAVVTAANHVLLVRRGRAPGKGQWAIPGGFLEGRERLLQGAIRELKEETGLTVANAELEAALRAVTVFDHPDRSQRGRIITHVHWFDLALESLPKVEGADDAEDARWFPFSDLPALEAELYEDHFHILAHFLGRMASR
jgi:bifunctional NMN adenylyltransferase/nudix hydrolase